MPEQKQIDLLQVSDSHLSQFSNQVKNTVVRTLFNGKLINQTQLEQLLKMPFKVQTDPQIRKIQHYFSGHITSE